MLLTCAAKAVRDRVGHLDVKFPGTPPLVILSLSIKMLSTARELCTLNC